ncbi:transmembrane protein 138 [Athalia rosae]|uniref:transmembrane protein 138 n=1 Tax=Athalia rosae TaxID=37344 RepID=UPI002033660B|nr:transmembrane protein 138 [Athalia rosae]
MSFISAKQYTVVLIIQYILLLYDISSNAFVILSQQAGNMLVLYIIQDLCIVVALTILLGGFFSTYVFQVGLMQLLYSRFRVTLVLCVTYLVLSIALHSCDISCQWTMSQICTQNRGVHVLYIIHRIVAVIYYYYYKRAALRISDPRFDEGSSWVQKQLNLP